MSNKAIALTKGTVSSLLLFSAIGMTSNAVMAKQTNICQKTANAALKACRFESLDDYWIEVANCINESDHHERHACLKETKTTRRDAAKECKDQNEARRDLCDDLGGDAYDPDFSPANFVDPLEIGNTVATNPYWPLLQGTQWVYTDGEETVTVTVTGKTKLIEGVTCLVVNDLVEVDGQPVENTDDWYAQDISGNVWYCGESVTDFEVFPGDNPPEAELVSREGSFKTGRDGAKPGIQMLANPQVGDVYRQEVALGNAEDAAEVLSTSTTESVPAASCTNDCLETLEFTPIEPGVSARKFYAPGVGLMLEIDMEGNRLELIEMTTP